MSTWTRADSIRLGTEAMRSGLADYAEAELALHIGARFMAHRFTDHEINEAIIARYRPAPSVPEVTP